MIKSADAMLNNVERYTLAYHTYFSDNLKV